MAGSCCEQDCGPPASRHDGFRRVLWIALAIWVAWLMFPTETLWVTTPLALNAGLIGAQRVLSSE